MRRDTTALDDVTWLADYREEEGIIFRIGRRQDELVAEWPGLARLFARRDGTAHSFERLPGARPEEVEKVQRGSAMLLLRHLRGELALHGAAVGWGGRAVGLIGRAKRGKSTLAAALCGDASFPAALYADDAMALDRAADGSWWVVPTEKNHWLDASTRLAFGDRAAVGYVGKWPTPAPATATAEAELVALVELSFEEEIATPRLVRLGGIDAIGALVPQAVRFALDDEERHKNELAVLSRLVDEVATYRLERPRDLHRLGESVSLVRALLRDAP